MRISAYTVLIYSALVLIGGMIGYNQAHSLPSLIAGTISGLLLLACAIGMFRKSILALAISVVISALLMFFFAYRFVLTAKFMPAGMMAILSLATVLIIIVSRRFKAKYVR